MLSPTEAQEFLASGYLSLPRFFSTDIIQTIREAFARLEHTALRLRETTTIDGSLFVVEARAKAPPKIERIVWCGGAEPVLAELGHTPELLEVAAQLLGESEMDQVINQAHIKRPGDGLCFSYHQDSYHRRYGTPQFDDLNGRGSFVQTLTAVDPMSPSNGGLWVVPESHHQGHIATVNGRLPEHAFERARAVPVHLEPGDTLLLSPFMVHGSEPNASKHPRRLFINGFCYPGANRRVYPGCGLGLRLRAPAGGAAVGPGAKQSNSGHPLAG
jgi:hypothetical protein